ncbi:MAG: glutamate-5-semialdehyde dehydrogenase [Planctomycetota bacterium]|jgi:glutamate-5-semialdehyde dehydrogenase|nr:glutamate-5-semialdehyde dehydrogenase [Planctomycetota bacterium]
MNDAAVSDLSAHVDQLCARAKPAGIAIAGASDAQRVAGLEAAALAIEAASDSIIAANAQDLAAADSAGLSAAMLDRLRLDATRLAGVVGDLRAVAAQTDPVGRVLDERGIAQGLQLQKISVPLGVVCIIFESRPNVTVDAAALCVRSGNACILRGGKEAVHSNRAFAAAFRHGLETAGLNPDAVQLVQEQDRALVPLLLARSDAIDIVVPRGGEGLIKAVCEVSKIPVVKHDKGVCSLYIHAKANLAMAVELVLNAKCQRPGVCNAIENLLVDAAIAPTALPLLSTALTQAGVTVRACERALPLLPGAEAATAADWDEEYLNLTLAVKVVDDLDDALAFTAAHSSQHSDGIITDDTEAAERYLRTVDSSAVYHNASTRFTDGAQFGLGAEVGISTNRLHARGPMGISELCTYKYVVRGTGQARA